MTPRRSSGAANNFGEVRMQDCNDMLIVEIETVTAVCGHHIPRYTMAVRDCADSSHAIDDHATQRNQCPLVAFEHEIGGKVFMARAVYS